MLKQCRFWFSSTCGIDEDAHLIRASNGLDKKQFSFSELNMSAADELIERTRIFHIFAIPHIKSH